MRTPTIATAGFVLAASVQGQEPRPELVAVRKAALIEPEYDSTPRYVAIALGQPIERVVWCVLDGTTLYVDRNGDGRLDGAKERLAARTEKLKDHFIAETHDYDAGDLPAAFPRGSW